MKHQRLAGDVMSLGLLQPRRDVQLGLDAVRELGVDQSARLLFRHKVTSIVLAALADLPSTTGGVAEELRDAIPLVTEIMRRRWLSSDRVHSLVGEIADARGIDWWTMKGFSFRQYYPDGRPRDLGDLDVLVETVDHAWQLTEGLRRAGYVYLDRELPWFKRDVETGKLYGQIRLTAPERDRLSIDLHAGPYSVRHCALMPLRFPRSASAGEGLALEDEVCAVVANAAGDCFLTGKLINDLTLALRHDIDVHYVRATLDEAALLPFLSTCLAAVREWCILDERQTSLANQLSAGLTAEPTPSLIEADPTERCHVVVDHARVVARERLLVSPDLVSVIAETAREAYGDDHPLTVSNTVQGLGANRLRTLDNWTCVRLVPVDVAAAATDASPEERTAGLPVPSDRWQLTEELEVVSYPAGALVRAAHDTFLPTVDFILPRGLVLQAAVR